MGLNWGQVALRLEGAVGVVMAYNRLPLLDMCEDVWSRSALASRLCVCYISEFHSKLMRGFSARDSWTVYMNPEMLICDRGAVTIVNEAGPFFRAGRFEKFKVEFLVFVLFSSEALFTTCMNNKKRQLHVVWEDVSSFI